MLNSSALHRAIVTQLLLLRYRHWIMWHCCVVVVYGAGRRRFLCKRRAFLPDESIEANLEDSPGLRIVYGEAVARVSTQRQLQYSVGTAYVNNTML